MQDRQFLQLSNGIWQRLKRLALVQDQLLQIYKLAQCIRKQLHFFVGHTIRTTKDEFLETAVASIREQMKLAPLYENKKKISMSSKLLRIHLLF